MRRNTTSPSNRIIQQATFTYSPLEEALEKQIKTIQRQGEKQIETVKNYKKQLDNTNEYSCEVKLLLSTEIEIFKNIYTN